MNKPETAPKGATVFLGVFEGLPVPVSTLWNSAVNKWVIANPQAGLYQDHWDDTYFETEWLSEDLLLAWCELPEWELPK